MVKIIILTAPFGEGHRSASDAISEYLRENYKGYNAILLSKPSASEEICKRTLARWLEASNLAIKVHRQL